MGNNVGRNLVSTAKLLRRITNSATKWAVKESAPTVPEEAGEVLTKLEAAQNAGAIGEEIVSGVAATGGAATEGAAGISVAGGYLIVLVGLAVILGVGIYIGYKSSLSDGPQTADQAKREHERAEDIKAAQDAIIDPSGLDAESLRTLDKALGSLQNQPPQKNRTKPRPDEKPEFSVHRSDETITTHGVPSGSAYDFSGVWLVKDRSHSWYCTRRYRFDHVADNRYHATFVGDVDGNCLNGEGHQQYPEPFDFEFKGGRFYVWQDARLTLLSHWEFDGQTIRVHYENSDGDRSSLESVMTREKQ